MWEDCIQPSTHASVKGNGGELHIRYCSLGELLEVRGSPNLCCQLGSGLQQAVLEAALVEQVRHVLHPRLAQIPTKRLHQTVILLSPIATGSQ